jgi:DNA-binding transcriptional MerR regulator
VSDRSHLSIGEVLSLLQDEFPDVTISKIRFLESQGLLDPERTPSGYRKFYEPDIDQLRWILRQQRENFLPLKVIKDRLAEVPLEELLASDGAVVVENTLPLEGLLPANGTPTPTPDPAPVGEAPEREPVPAPDPDPDPPVESLTPAGDRLAALQEAPPEPAPPPPPPPPPEPTPAAVPDPGASVLDTGESSMSMTAEELVKATGLTARQLTDLESYGLIAPDTIDNTAYYGDDALIVGRTAAAFMRHGVEARHLRMYKVAAEREAGFLEQLIMPILKQRSATSHHDAVAMLDDLVGLGDTLRQAMLRHALREHLDRR